MQSLLWLKDPCLFTSKRSLPDLRLASTISVKTSVTMEVSEPVPDVPHVISMSGRRSEEMETG